MEQLSFFKEPDNHNSFPGELLDYRSEFISESASRNFLIEFIKSVPWKQQVKRVYNKDVVTPRLKCWYGESVFSDHAALGGFELLPWTKDLLYLKSLVEPVAGVEFNSLLMSYYRDGNDSIAWHSDRARVKGLMPVVASLTFGQARRFDIRKRIDHKVKFSIRLENGSFLLMKSGFQEEWEHAIHKSGKLLGERINLTFRVI